MINENMILGEPLLICRQIKKQYKDFSLDCSLTLKKGTVTGLIGKNGAGKTTIFKAILGIIHTDGGQMLWEGKEVPYLDMKSRFSVGVVLSDSGFSGYLTPSDVSAIMAAMYPTFDKKDFMEKCSRFSIPLNKKIKDFSTGMKAKLKVLTALSHKTKLLILDEPTSGLDVIARDEILQLLREYMEDEEHAILISSHISSDLEGLCDEIYMIDNGNVILHEDTDVLLDEYGILKITAKEYEALDKKYILSIKEEVFGYRCLTNQKSFYQDNYPSLTIEKGSIDELILMMVSGKRIA